MCSLNFFGRSSSSQVSGLRARFSVLSTGIRFSKSAENHSAPAEVWAKVRVQPFPLGTPFLAVPNAPRCRLYGCLSLLLHFTRRITNALGVPASHFHLLSLV